MSVRIWTNRKKREQFFDELRELIAKYEDPVTVIQRHYAEDPTSSRWIMEDGDKDYPDYDPTQSRFVTGVVVVITTNDINDWEDVITLIPERQSVATTDGMLYHALHD